MWKKGLLLSLVFMLLTGCSGQQAITKPVEKAPETAEISFGQSVTATVKDSLALQIPLDDYIMQGIATETSGLTNELLNVTIGKTEYTLYQNGVTKGNNSYHLTEQDSQRLEQVILDVIKQQGFHIQLTSTTGKLLFQDQGQMYPLDENQMKTLNEQIQQGQFLDGMPSFQNIPYPDLNVLVDKNLSFTFMKKSLLAINWEGGTIGYFQFPNEQFYDQIQAKYPQLFTRTGIFKYQAATFFESEYAKPIVHDNKVFELDMIMRDLLGSTKVAKPKALPNDPFIIKFISSLVDEIRIYKNGYWSQNGEYFFKSGVFGTTVQDCGGG